MAARSGTLVAGSTSNPWGVGLSSRRFRTLLLVLAGVPMGVAYAWNAIVLPLTWNQVSDFRTVYLDGARIIAAGRDPYQCAAAICSGHARGWLGAAGSVYPPFPLWILQPVAGYDPRLVDGIALFAATACVAAFVWLMLRALEARDWQFGVLAVLVTMGFAPTLIEVQNRNFQVLLLALSGVAVAAWVRGDRWWGGAALGFGLAIKLVQAPLLLLGLWGRRWITVAVAVASWAVLWAVAAPRYLTEYLFQVLPSVGQGSGEEMDISPLAAFARILHPESLYQQGRGVDAVVLALAAATAIGVIIITLRRLGAPRTDRQGRVLEIALAFAASPLLLTLVWAGQLVLLLVPMIALLDHGLRRGSRGMVAQVAIAWFLIGPVYLAFTNAFAAGLGFPLLFQVWSESALAGVVILWVTSLQALSPSKERAAERALT